jgi:hypothetical protein
MAKLKNADKDMAGGLMEGAGIELMTKKMGKKFGKKKANVKPKFKVAKKKK